MGRELSTFQQELARGVVHKRIVWPFIVVAPDELVGALAHLVEVLEQICIQHLFTVCAIEAFDQAVLHGHSRLDEDDLDLVALGPLFHGLSDELRAVINAKSLWLATPLY